MNCSLSDQFPFDLVAAVTVEGGWWRGGGGGMWMERGEWKVDGVLMGGVCVEKVVKWRAYRRHECVDVWVCGWDMDDVDVFRRL